MKIIFLHGEINEWISIILLLPSNNLFLKKCKWQGHGVTHQPPIVIWERERERERWQWWAQGVTIIIRIIKKPNDHKHYSKVQGCLESCSMCVELHAKNVVNCEWKWYLWWKSEEAYVFFAWVINNCLDPCSCFFCNNFHSLHKQTNQPTKKKMLLIVGLFQKQIVWTMSVVNWGFFLAFNFLCCCNQ